MVVGDGMVGKSNVIRRETCLGFRRSSCAVMPATPDTRVPRAAWAGVRASILAMKRGNARGAKGRRKVDA